MGMDPAPDDRLRTLQYWWMLELFSPQKVPKPIKQSTRPEGRQVIEWRPGEPLPWQYLRPPAPVGKTKRRWQHTVYLGLYDLEDVYQYLHHAFAEDRDAYDERRAGVSACAAVMLDDRGVLMVDSATLSSALWAVARIRDSGVAPSPQWAGGFSLAAQEFKEEVDVVEGLRREAARAEEARAARAGDERTRAARVRAEEARAEKSSADRAREEKAPPQDEGSLWTLLRIAHEASGIAGTPRLAGQRIIISSVIVSDRRTSDATADIDFLNSFFLDDLAAVQVALADGRCSPALSAYLTADALLPTGLRSDVMTEHAVVDAGVGIDRLPKGRWPSNPEHGLALRQQFAVNRALDDLSGTSGLMGVNGPPGTGKTTMLRDILAGNVVERARRLASLQRPEHAFTATTHRWSSGDGYPRIVRQLRPELTGFEMVVASANNAAVENISVEIPAREAIASRWRDDADYFADIASAALAASGVGEEEEESSEGAGRTGEAERTEGAGRRAWGLVAARLGNKRNRGDFRSAFWFDVTDPSTKQRVPGTAPRMQTRLSQWRDGTAPRTGWSRARENFRRAERRVDELLAQRRAAQNRLNRLEAALREESELAAQAQRQGAEASAAVGESRAYAAVVEHAEAECSEARTIRDRQVETRPGALETLFTLGRAVREWRARLEPLEDRLRAAEQHWRRTCGHAHDLAGRARELSDEAATLEASRVRAAREATGLRSRVAEDHDTYGPAYPERTRAGKAREKSTPWLDARLDEARSELFLAAMRLHEDFLANAADDMLKGLRAAIEVVAGAHPRNLEPEKLLAAWQIFFLAVPMVSTTFASVGRMLAGLGAESLGWLLIDEAGQAPPQYAVGGIWRAQRVIAVGDPLQLQPVVTMPRKAQRDIAAAFGVSPTWIPPRASVQTLADRTSRDGTTLRQGEEPVWVSMPLTVHRRCDDPMFGLCNEMAYDGMMVSEVHRRLDDPERPDLFDGPDGEPRILASQWFDVPATTSGTHLQDEQIAQARRLLEDLGDRGIATSQMIAISPFRVVADELESLGRQYPGLRGGTIHTAQGREADVVFLVLGGDPSSPGAKGWASSTVNLVNVAVSRAKRRLYVIGDRAAWAPYPYFNGLAAALGQRPGEAPEAGG